MKALKLSSYIAMLGVVVTSFYISSCKKDNEGSGCNGAPVITQVVRSTDREEVITSGSLNQFVTIVGQNLCNINSIRFNDVEVSADEFYAEAGEITVRIPTTIPNDVVNKVFISGAGGATEANFTIDIPPLKISSIDNEYAAAGTTMIAVGESFVTYGFDQGQGKVMFGDVEATLTKVTADSLYITVPVGATPGAFIKAVASNGDEAVYPYPYQDNTNIIFDFDGKNGNANPAFLTTGPVPAPTSGRFIRIKQTIGDWAGTEFISGHMPLPDDVVQHPEKYVFKFEVNTQKPFNKNRIRFFFDQGGWSGGNQIIWDPNISTFDTFGKWRTVTFDFGAAINKPIPVTGFYKNEYVFHGPNALDADISFDNFRIVPKH